MLKMALTILICDMLLSFGLWLLMIAVAGVVTWMLPMPSRAAGGLISIVVATLLAATIRAAFLKPVFLIMIIVRFHALTEGQVIDAAWDGRLTQISDKFRQMWRDPVSSAWT
jgi:hypothetical protein